VRDFDLPSPAQEAVLPPDAGKILIPLAWAAIKVALGEAPVAIAAAAVDWAKKHYHDVLIVDTAGRLAIDQPMMEEIKALHARLSPTETLFVVDAMAGQDAVNTARAFGEAPITPHQTVDGANRIAHGHSAASTTGAIRREWRACSS
jgi:hypothetical protein